MLASSRTDGLGTPTWGFKNRFLYLIDRQSKLFSNFYLNNKFINTLTFFNGYGPAF